MKVTALTEPQVAAIAALLLALAAADAATRFRPAPDTSPAEADGTAGSATRSARPRTGGRRFVLRPVQAVRQRP